MSPAQTRVLLFQLPEMMKSIIGAAAGAAPGLRLVAADAASLPKAVDEAGADAVILAYDDVDQIDQLLFRFPSLLVLSILELGADVLLCELRPHRESLGELSAPALLSALRSVRHRGGGDG